MERHVSDSEYETQISARERYQEALKPLTKSKDWSKWLANWETAITLAQEKNIPEASSPVSWVTEFFTAVRPIAETWTTSYRVTQRQSIEKGLITYRDIAHDFREEMRSMRFGLKGKLPNIAKGAFGPSYAGQDNPDQDAGDAQNSAEGASQRSRRRPTKRTRAPDEDINSPSTVTRSCEACGLSHPISNCYYVFPEKAPRWFTENPEIRLAVDDALQKDAAL